MKSAVAAANRQFTDAQLREGLIAFLRTHAPVDPRRPMAPRLHGQEAFEWLKLLGRKGWKAPAWPQEYGGMGLPLRQQLIYQEIMNRYSAPRVIDLGVALVGPTVMRFGTDAQKAAILPRIIAGEDIWCQGYSEPNSGSDLASLRTTGTIEGDTLTINGQKTWTTQASYANRFFLLVRTGGGTRKQQGISFVTMHLPHDGVIIRPIETISGETEFAEVFLDGARVPVSNVIGDVGDGWQVAKVLLGHERLSIGSPMQAKQSFRVLLRIVNETGQAKDSLLMQKVNRLATDLYDIQSLFDQVSDAAILASKLDAEYSMLKIMSSELFQRIANLCLQAAGERAGCLGESAFGDSLIDLHHAYMLSRPASIYSGTNDVQRNLVARAILGD